MPANTKKIRVLIIDDSATVRQTLAAVLESDPEIEVIGVQAEGCAAMADSIRASRGGKQAKTRSPATRGVTLEGVTVAYGAVEVLHGVSLRVDEGEMVVAEFVGTVDGGGVVGKLEGDHRGLDEDLGAGAGVLEADGDAGEACVGERSSLLSEQRGVRRERDVEVVAEAAGLHAGLGRNIQGCAHAFFASEASSCR